MQQVMTKVKVQTNEQQDQKQQDKKNHHKQEEAIINENEVLVKPSELTFAEKKDIWTNHATHSTTDKFKCDSCKKSTYHSIINFNEHNYCYKCWIKKSKKHSSKKSKKVKTSKKQKVIKEVKAKPQLDPKIYITGNKWENIR